MALRFYLAGSAVSEQGNNWRASIVGHGCFTRGNMTCGYILDEYEVISYELLPGGFDYIGAYIEEKGHNSYGMEREFAILHRRCIDLTDVMWVWLPLAGEGTWAEVGYATAKNIPVVFATTTQHEKNIEDDYNGWFIQDFANIHRFVSGS